MLKQVSTPLANSGQATAEAGAIDLTCGEITDESEARRTLNIWLKKFIGGRNIMMAAMGFDAVIKEKTGGKCDEPDIEALGSWAAESIARKTGSSKAGLEIDVADWVYDFIRSSVYYKGARQELVMGAPQKKLGACKLHEVFARGEGDCVGLAKLYRYVAGKFFGLDVGIVEVTENLKGVEELHACCLLKTQDCSQMRLVDVPENFNIRPSMRSKRHPRVRARARTESGALEDKIMASEEFGKLDFKKIFGLSEDSILALTKIEESFYMNYMGANPRDIIPLLDEAIRLDSNCVFAYGNRAVCKTQITPQDFDGAIADCKKALSLNPRLNGPKINLLATLLEKRDYDAVIQLADELLSPNNPQGLKTQKFQALALINRGSAHKQKGDQQKAMADYMRASELGLPPSEHGGMLMVR